MPLFLCGLRFRSITKQYFRKADGILVMYDVTAECSFLAVRNWMSSIQVRGGLGSGAARAPLLHTSSNSLSGADIFQCPRRSPTDLVKRNYQSRCLWWSVQNQSLSVEGDKASGSPLNQGGLSLWQNMVGPVKTAVWVCKQPTCTDYIPYTWSHPTCAQAGRSPGV